jgi:hypothetical protein|uniref:Uncharacterized protein n=1 Tax=viral metagenome TaxID=1070528 RepID=A0A6C0AH23_9ZZZZ
MPSRKRGGTLAALGVAASNLLVPLGLFYAVKHQQSRIAKSRRFRKFHKKSRRV